MNIIKTTIDKDKLFDEIHKTQATYGKNIYISLNKRTLKTIDETEEVLLIDYKQNLIGYLFGVKCYIDDELGFGEVKILVDSGK